MIKFLGFFLVLEVVSLQYVSPAEPEDEDFSSFVKNTFSKLFSSWPFTMLDGIDNMVPIRVTEPIEDGYDTNSTFHANEGTGKRKMTWYPIDMDKVCKNKPNDEDICGKKSVSIQRICRQMEHGAQVRAYCSSQNKSDPSASFRISIRYVKALDIASKNASKQSNDVPIPKKEASIPKIDVPTSLVVMPAYLKGQFMPNTDEITRKVAEPTQIKGPYAQKSDIPTPLIDTPTQIKEPNTQKSDISTPLVDTPTQVKGPYASKSDIPTPLIAMPMQMKGPYAPKSDIPIPLNDLPMKIIGKTSPKTDNVIMDAKYVGPYALQKGHYRGNPFPPQVPYALFESEKGKAVDPKTLTKRDKNKAKPAYSMSMYGIAMSSGALGTVLIVLILVITYSIVRMVRIRNSQKRIEKAKAERKKVLRLQKLSSLISDDSEIDEEMDP